MTLKRPNMNSSGSKGICCEGPNKGLMYDKGSECEQGFQFNEEACECIQCSDVDDDPTFCSQQGFPPCYICNQGECVPGPECCNEIGVLAYSADCNDPNRDTETPNICCSYRLKYFIVERSYEMTYAWQGFGENFCERTTNVTERVFIGARECEELIFKCNPITIDQGSFNSCPNFPLGLQETEICSAVLVDPDGNERPARSSIAPCRPVSGGLQSEPLCSKYGDHQGSPFRSILCCDGRFAPYSYRPYEFRSRFFIGSGTNTSYAPNAGHPTVTIDSSCADGKFSCQCQLKNLFNSGFETIGYENCPGCGEVRRVFLEGFGPEDLR